MVLRSMARAVSRWWSRHSVPALPGPAETRRLLLKECARSERARTPLSVLIFPCEEARALADRLMALLRQRLRGTDAAGWLDGGRLCVVLPGTPAAGAEKVAADVARSLPAYPQPPRWAVYTYRRAAPGRSGPGAEFVLAEGPEVRSEPASNGSSIPEARPGDTPRSLAGNRHTLGAAARPGLHAAGLSP